MLQAFAELGRVLVATRSTNPRSLTATELADRARGLRCFDHVEALEDAVLARNRGRELASAAGKPLLVSGSLYLLQDLSALRGDLIAVRPGPYHEGVEATVWRGCAHRIRQRGFRRRRVRRGYIVGKLII